MRALLFVLPFIVLFPNLTFGLFNDSILLSTVILFNNNFTSASYGVQLDENKIIMPINGDEIYQDLGRITDFNFDKIIPTVDSISQLNDAAFILETSPRVYFSDDKRKYLRISRYPICNNDLKIIYLRGNETLVGITPGNETFVGDFSPKAADTCEKYFTSFNPKKQACSRRMARTRTGMPLISSVDNFNYLVGLSDPKSTINSTLYNFIVDECYGFPAYQQCDDYLRLISPSKYTFCNSAKISSDLVNFGKGIILFGNVQGHNYTSFIPFGLGTVLDDQHVLLPSTVSDSLKNYEIYGTGEELKLAFMINDGHVSIFDKNEYYEIKTGKKILKLIKFENNIFQTFSKAQLFFDDSQKVQENIKSFQFNQNKFELQNWKNNDGIKIKDDERFLLGAPMYFYERIIGFKNQTSYISIFEIKEFLQKTVTNLSFTIPETTVEFAVNESTVFYTEMMSIKTSTENSKANPMTKTNGIYGSTNYETTPTTISSSSSSVSKKLILFINGIIFAFCFAIQKL